MSQPGLTAAQEKMAAAGVPGVAIDVFSHYYRELEAGATGLIAEADIDSLTDLPKLAELSVPEQTRHDALAATVVIKLNGGLGTSMGMQQAKSLLPVADGRTFLDLIVEQVRSARAEFGVTLPLVLMNSFRTAADSLAALEQHPDIAVPGIPQDFGQNQEPKLLVSDLTPVEWPADPSLEWCPPGHGDIYTALLTSGMLQTLLDAGYRYATVSNSDNLGATPDPVLAGWFADSGAPFAMEVCQRTAADRKGGHLAVNRADGQLILREKAQTAEEDLAYFTDETRHRYFNTNSIWLDLAQLSDTLTERGGVLGLPMIRNRKNVDPTDGQSPQVYQIETAMGAAIGVFPGATAIEVPRSRFLPVKTTNDLLLLRSDAYAVRDNGSVELVAEAAPLVTLDKVYSKIAAFEERFPAGAPSLREARSLTVEGDWTFGADVAVTGDAVLSGEGGRVPDGTRLG
ncbi:UTP--glucose-1-phosphate uridylyltransferase [Granulicoccus phenolivorans]|uniref:UTP--glucose-1-phosphate uridylyltransferase n=1 Tax=Granulicoccus phenolivorans TaxID=266854 RepID=UPI0004265C0B|nr:UTP--glucose-1-phosphate uridylyltransferase [Granulicoccus phenolivorans]